MPLKALSECSFSNVRIGIIDLNDVQKVLTYHNETKHYYARYARSSGYLDWESQPHSFLNYSGAENFPLIFPNNFKSPNYDELYSPSFKNYHPFSFESISMFFRFSFGISAWKESGPSRWALRVNPSSGNLHPTESYIISDSIEKDHLPRIYHYVSEDHRLERRGMLTEEVWKNLISTAPGPSFFVGITSIIWREAWKYGERAFRYCQHDIGHAIGAVIFAARLLGWKVKVLSQMSSSDLANILGTGSSKRADLEWEEPAVLVCIYPDKSTGPAPLQNQIKDPIKESKWYGSINALSTNHVDWELDVISLATKQPGPIENIFQLSSKVSMGSSCILPATKIILQRRSALALDGMSTISRSSFMKYMKRIFPQNSPPWNSLWWKPRAHLVLFIHRVEDVEPGIYILVRDLDQIEDIKNSLSHTFDWAPISKEMPLFRLKTGDVRLASKQLSCNQSIAADGFFSIAMMVDFTGSIGDHGAWFYRNLYWETGVIGQVLYLESEAQGARSTGIGCYFDDHVHELLDIKDMSYQVLYHFTIGISIEDIRLTTLPPYLNEDLRHDTSGQY